MFNIGMPEMAVIGVVALIVVGPKDLPQMFRKVGQFVGKARGMARDFQRAMEQAADDSGVGDVAADVKRAASMKNLGLDDIKTTMNDYKSSFEPKKVDAAREHAARVAAAKEANEAAGQWPPEGVDVVENSEVVDETPKPAAKKAAAKKPATKKTAAKKPAAKKTAAKKPAAKKTAAAKKPAAKKPAAKTSKT
ncbi:Sec-independent protein translocase protein TatB [Amylibacter sp. IMCC11727]|uniref:Sec-independent protein translocase protein TatB n=1 Tax=Amylibacter sp. IMCC11727 TaxID=3039851 RepID=UPI00244DED30|nr:Sec-independent protein translocase protein TatB [Amylibacter sp. IMCC11727]WGI23422.1 Sec-independent protein translocase protein TatB [Amylibacter sp. IMCC11727]